MKRPKIARREATMLARMCGTHPDRLGLINELLCQYLDSLPDSHQEQRRLVAVAAQSILVNKRTNASAESGQRKV